MYELAKELNISSKELIEKLGDLDVSISSHMSSIEEEEADLIRDLFKESKEDTSPKKVEDKNMGVKKEESNEEPVEEGPSIELSGDIIVKDLADQLNAQVSQVITKLISLGVMASQNQEIDFDTAQIIAEEFGYKVILRDTEDDEVDEAEETEEMIAEFQLDYEDDPKDMVTRPPVVTVMGHVDHGKTSLLDAIRHTSVTEGEAGGITQHIGAYSVKVNDKKVVFLDTPGHEAFTSMRARGASITDIAVLVVAADDGVMPQTIEAINHARAAGVPIIVAINKIDKPTANVERLKQELTENGLLPEDWGGDTITVPVSAKQRENIGELLDMILLVAEMEELKANPNRNAVGTIIEAQLDKGKGPLATVLVQKGTLSTGDMVVSGTASGRIRAMIDDKGNRVDKAGPSTPVVILGLSEVPEAGDQLFAVENRELQDLC